MNKVLFSICSIMLIFIMPGMAGTGTGAYFSYDRQHLSDEMTGLESIESSLRDNPASLGSAEIPGLSSTRDFLEIDVDDETIILPTFMETSYQGSAGILIASHSTLGSGMKKLIACIVIGGLMLLIYSLVGSLS